MLDSIEADREIYVSVRFNANLVPNPEISKDLEMYMLSTGFKEMQLLVQNLELRGLKQMYITCTWIYNGTESKL